ncbi:MAG: DUF6531 domain-containing protein [Oscillospiraceae bacterium]|nr:DUF6531 domain-containing protein [Oscillospiraceae bacterium]
MFKKEQITRLLAVLMAFVMVFGTVPAYAFDSEDSDVTDIITEVIEEEHLEIVDDDDSIVMEPEVFAEAPEEPGAPEFIGFAPLAAISLPDDDMHDFVPDYEYDYNAPDSHSYKYFKIYEYGTVNVLGEGPIGGTAQYKAPMIPDGRLIAFEFLNEQTQEIRLELWENINGAPGNYLGLISCGIAQGQWGVLGEEQWHMHSTEEGDIVPVANYLIWDGLYWDTNRQEFVFPGEDENGEIEQGVYNYFVRFQPTDENTYMFTVDVPLVISYTEEDITKLLQLRSLYGLDYDGDPISMISGNFTWDYTDISVYGAQPLEFIRHYNALDDNDGELGFGWRHNYMYSIDKSLVFANLVLPNGYRVSYNIKGDGSFVGPDGEGYYLESYNDGYRLTDQALTQFFFNSDGYLTEIEDIGGNRTVITRNGAEIASVSNRSGTLTFSYSGGKISSITDQTDRSVYYSYNGNDDLVTFKNADSDTINYTYESHRITEISDLNGNTYLRNTFDSLGRIAEQYLSDQGISIFAYDVKNRVSSITDPNGAVRKYYYDLKQNVTAVEDASGQTRYEYENGRISSVIDRLGNITSYKYDEFGNQTTVIYPDGTSEVSEYNDKNLVTKLTRVDDSTLRYQYDDRGNVTSFIDSRGYERVFTYDSSNNILTKMDALGNITSFTYDSKGNCLTETDPLGNTTAYEYDNQGRLIKQINADDSTIEYEYTSAGKLVKTTDAAGNEYIDSVTGNGFNDGNTDPMGYSVKTVYNEQNKPISIIDAEGNITTYEYDDIGQLIKTTDALGYSIVYRYDQLGRMVSMTDALGFTWSYDYDPEGRITSVIDGIGNASSIVNNSMGRVMSHTNARGYSTSYTYDAMGRATRITDALGNYSRNVYDTNGNLVEQHDRNGNKWEYIYDANNRIVEAKDPLGFVTTYVYDANGQGTKTISAVGAQQQSIYDSMGRRIKSIDAEGNETVYNYDILGRLTKTTFPDGMNIQNVYNSNGWLIKSIAENGGETYYTYNKNGQVVTITDALGGVTSFVNDALGRTISFTDALGGTTSYTYDANGNISTATDALGGITSYAYDKLNRVISITDPLGSLTYTEYDENGNVSKVTNADGGVVTYTYDALDRLISYNDTEGYAWSFIYDANGNSIGMVDGRGNSTSTEYDGLDRVVKQIDQINNSTSIIYDADDRVVVYIDAEGAETNYDYNLNGNIVKVTDALGNSTHFTYDSMNRVSTMTDARWATSAYTYMATGEIATITDALSGVKIYEYDLLGRLIKETNELGEITSYSYDALGQVSKVTNPLGDSDSFTYDALGRIKTVTDKNGNVTKYNYDANGNIIETVDAFSNSSFFEYDAMNRLVKVTLYRKDSMHNVNEAQITLYSYDKRGLVTKEVNAAGDATSYAYDGNGNMIRKIDADGIITEVGYESRNLIDAVNYSDSKKVQFTYNKNGELIAMSDWNGTVNFELDILGRIKSVNDQNEKVTSYTYDAVNNKTSIKYPDGKVSLYSYDMLSRLVNLKDAESQNTKYSYDAVGRLITQVYPNGWNETYEYDAAGQLIRQLATDPSMALNKAVETLYTYDPQGNILSEYRDGALKQLGEGSSMHGMERFNLVHTYDSLNRLTSTTGDQGYKAHNYTYDSLGNLIYEQIHNKGNEYWYNSLNQQIKKVVDKKDTYTYTFDKRGNLVEGMYHKNQNHSNVVESYVYDATNRMVKGINEAGEESHYIYNGLGYLITNEWLVKKSSYGYTGVEAYPSDIVASPAITPAKFQVVHKDFVLDYTSPLKNVIMEYESGNTGLTYRYTYGLKKVNTVITGIPNGVGSVMQYTYNDELDEFVLTTEDPGHNVIKNSIVKLWYHHDHLGSTSYLTDNVSGKVTSYVSYDDWGALTSKAVLRVGARELDLVSEYTVHPYDAVLDIYFAQARMYDPKASRWLSPDIIKGSVTNPMSLVRYLYCDNNPLVFVDPTGLVKINFKNVQTAITGKDINGSSDTYVSIDEALSLYSFLTLGKSDWVRQPGKLYWESPDRTGPAEFKNYLEYYNAKTKFVQTIPIDAWRVNGIYFMKLSCLTYLLKRSGVNPMVTEEDVMFRSRDWTAEKGKLAGLSDLLTKFVYGPMRSPFRPDNYNYDRYSFFGTYLSTAYENALKFRKTTYWKKVLSAASTAPDAWGIAQSIPDGYIVPVGPYLIPVKPVAFAGVWLLMGAADWLGFEAYSPPDNFLSALGAASGGIANLLGEGIDNWIEASNSNKARKAIAEYHAFQESEYLFLMDNYHSAAYFANDLEAQMAISLGGDVEFFSAFIPGYTEAYEDVVSTVIKMNRAWGTSEKEMKSYIKQEYPGVSDDIIKEYIKMWNIQK